MSLKFTTRSSNLQDEFAFRVIMTAHVLKNENLDYKGTFLDIGCGHGLHHNNSLSLEHLGWTGVMVDIDKKLVEHNKTIRTSPCHAVDVTVPGWTDVILDKKVYDYISFDVDDSTVKAVKAFPWDKIKFKVCTIEHDAYRVGDEARDLIRKTMKDNGYFCIAYDVQCSDGPFEDWYVDPALPAVAYMKYFSVAKRAIDVLFVQK